MSEGLRISAGTRVKKTKNAFLYYCSDRREKDINIESFCRQLDQKPRQMTGCKFALSEKSGHAWAKSCPFSQSWREILTLFVVNSIRKAGK
jgi:hypothetical protein